MGYTVEATEDVAQFLRELSVEEFTEVSSRIRMLEEFGPSLDRPHAGTLRDKKVSKLKELRIRHERKQFRIIYAFDSARNAILLVGGDKVPLGGKRWYPKFIERAKQLLNEHELRLEEKKRLEEEGKGAVPKARRISGVKRDRR